MTAVTTVDYRDYDHGNRRGRVPIMHLTEVSVANQRLLFELIFSPKLTSLTVSTASGIATVIPGILLFLPSFECFHGELENP